MACRFNPPLGGGRKTAMNEIMTYFQNLPNGDLALWAAIVFLLIVELVIHKNATRKRPLI